MMRCLRSSKRQTGSNTTKMPGHQIPESPWTRSLAIVWPCMATVHVVLLFRSKDSHDLAPKNYKFEPHLSCWTIRLIITRHSIIYIYKGQGYIRTFFLHCIHQNILSSQDPNNQTYHHDDEYSVTDFSQSWRESSYGPMAIYYILKAQYGVLFSRHHVSPHILKTYKPMILILTYEIKR
jgi:hypothetical protein